MSLIQLRDPYQTDEWAKIKTESGYEVHKVGSTFIYVRKTPIGNILEIPYPIDTADVLREQVQRTNPISLSIFNDLQYSESSFEGFGPIRKRVSCKVDLTRSVGQLWRDLKKQNRNAIRQAEKKGCTFHVGETDRDFEEFYDHYSSLARLKRFNLMRKKVMKRTFMSPLASTYVVRVDGKPGAVAFVLYSETIARFWYGAGAPEFYAFRPSNFLHWHIMLEAKSRACLYYDLDGTNQFKTSFGGKLYDQQVVVRDSFRSRLVGKLVSATRSLN